MRYFERKDNTFRKGYTNKDTQVKIFFNLVMKNKEKKIIKITSIS